MPKSRRAGGQSFWSKTPQLATGSHRCRGGRYRANSQTKPAHDHASFRGQPNRESPQDEFERKLYLIRKSATKAIRDSGMHSSDLFYVCSLSSRTLVYKGMLSTEQLPKFYHGLARSGLREPSGDGPFADFPQTRYPTGHVLNRCGGWHTMAKSIRCEEIATGSRHDRA